MAAATKADPLARQQAFFDSFVAPDCVHLRLTEAKATGFAQEMGPLKPSERRIVHLASGDIAGVSSESIGDAFLKTVIISTKG